MKRKLIVIVFVGLISACAKNQGQTHLQEKTMDHQEVHSSIVSLPKD